MPEPATPAATEPESGKDESKILEIVKEYTDTIRAIHRCAGGHLDPAFQESSVWITEFAAQLKKRIDGPKEELVAYLVSESRTEAFNLHLISPDWDILAQSLLIFGFSTFDAFLGRLLFQLYREVPTLIYKLEEKEVKVSELLNSTTIEKVIDALIERDISNLLRESYDKVFSVLEGRHGFSTLKQFDSWPKFIEAAQRRNLITHCNGFVNFQYMETCKKAQAKLHPEIEIGKQLKVSTAYLRQALDILYEVGVMMA